MEKRDLPHTILVALGDGASSRVAGATLAASGFRVETVHTGPETIRAFALLHPDLLLLDVSLPDMDGHIVAQTIRRQLDARYTPILMAASVDDEETVSQAFESGATAFSLKPFQWTIETHRIRYLIRNANIQQQLHRRMVELQHAQKQDAIGRLAGGIAHDFNNMLTAIINGSELALLAIDEPEDVQIELSEIRKATERAVALTRQLLAFSRRQTLNLKTLDVNGLMTGMEKMLRRMLSEKVKLVVRQKRGIPPIKVDPGKMEQVIMNLAVNANDAMPNGGMLTISTHYLSISEEVVVSVRDTGLGITSDVQQRMFEPFFTTKQLGEGTGLGLSTVFGIIKQSGGRLKVESQLGKGSCFHVVLPASEETPDAVSAVDQDVEHSGTETVLLVEDDDSLRDVCAKRLRGYGYTVLEAADGAQAMALASAYRGKVELLFTDLVLPKLNGRELAERLRRRDPNLRVLYMTGYAEHRLLDHGLTSNGDHLLHKPFPLGDLHPTVRRVLDEQPAASAAR